MAEASESRILLSEALVLAALPFAATSAGILEQVGYAGYFDVPLQQVPFTGGEIVYSSIRYSLFWLMPGAAMLVLWAVSEWLGKYPWVGKLFTALLCIGLFAEVSVIVYRRLDLVADFAVVASATGILLFLAALLVQFSLFYARLAGARQDYFSFARHNKRLAAAIILVSWFALAYPFGAIRAATTESFYVIQGRRLAVAVFTDETAVCFHWRALNDGTRQLENGLSFIPLGGVVVERQHLGAMRRSSR